jgi:DNA-directed RNA polymerase specialized sigma24 family protein
MRTPLVHRQALLLVEFEGFSVVEAAEVLAVSERQLAELLTQAKEDIFGSAANSTHINHDGTDNPRTVITALEATAMA